VLWPVLLGSEPRLAPWSVGDLMTARLTWCDSPDLPDEMVLRDVDVHADVLRSVDGQPWAHLVRVGTVAAARAGRHEAGEVRISGCPAYDAYLQSNDQVPVTSGVVRRIRVVLRLHDRGVDRWIPRPGAVRVHDVPDTAANRLSDDRPTAATAPDPGTHVFLSPEQYFARDRDHLPPRQWQAHGFVVDVEVPLLPAASA
jgi:hypothetical protein